MSSRKLLFVDDEPDLALVVEQQFEGKIDGYDIDLVFAENGADALKKLDENPDIEIVLTDINMPVMDGLEFVAHAKKLERLLRIIMVSAYNDMSNIRKAMNRGAYDFITKPVDFEDLSETIVKALKAVDQFKAEEAELKRLKEIEKEMEMVKKMQTSLLPSSVTPFFQNTSFEIFGTMVPARIVGGGFYDFFPAGADKLAVVVGETSAKGMKAVTYVSSAREAIRGFTNKSPDVGICIQQINDYLFYQNNENIPSFALFFGIFNILTGELEYVSAGLPHIIKVSKEGIVSSEEPTISALLGEKLDNTFPIKKVQLADRETLVVYSNALQELKNADQKSYTDKRIQEVVAANHDHPLSSVVDNLILDVRNFIAPLEQTNDYVVLCLRFKG